MMERWYDFTGDEASYNTAYSRMKPVAGYHIFIDLIFQLSFPRERIMFCSNHAENCNSINDSFEPAKIETPEIPTKKDPKVEAWISAGYNNQYVAFRRTIISSCVKIQEELKFDQNNQVFQLSKFPGDGAERLSGRDADDYLETLRRIFPMTEESSVYRMKTLRLFARTLSEPWASIQPGEKKDGKSLVPKGWKQSFGWVLKNVRNWTSHNSRALNNMDIADAAFLFLVAIRITFKTEQGMLDNEEKCLLSIMSSTDNQFDDEELKDQLDKSYSVINSFYTPIKDPTNIFGGMLRSVVDEYSKSIKEQDHITPNLRKYMYQLLWHELFDRGNSTIKFDELVTNDSSKILAPMLRRIYSRSF